MFVVIVAVILFVFAIGPRCSLNTRFKVPDLPPDLDDYLARAEARFDDITPGAEKTIIWADPSRKHKTPIAFVYLHGFSACRQEAAPVPDNIAAHFGCNLYYARLAGNGRSDDAMAVGSVNKWLNDASEALAIASQIGERTVIIGTSTGASIGWWISHQRQFQQSVAALVFFSPNFGVNDPRAGILLAPWGAHIARALVGPYRTNEPYSPMQDRYWANRYPTAALLPMIGMVSLAKRISPAATNLPVFIMYSTQDPTVDAAKIAEFYEQLPAAKQALVLEAEAHVLVGDIMAPQNTRLATAAVIEFLQRFAALSALK